MQLARSQRKHDLCSRISRRRALPWIVTNLWGDGFWPATYTQYSLVKFINVKNRSGVGDMPQCYLLSALSPKGLTESPRQAP